MAGFEPTVPASERLQTRALDHPTTGIGHTYTYTYSLNQNEKYLREVPHHYMQTTCMFRSKTRILRKHEEEGKLPSQFRNTVVVTSLGDITT
jgi:hypothetical protein